MRILFAAFALILIPCLAFAVTVEGNKYPATVTIDGKTMKLIGAGLREKWWVDVYTMGAYTTSGSCKTSDLINKDEAKYLRLDMLRDVSAEKMATAIAESFSEHMPKNASAKLKQQRKTFQGYFKKECTEKSKLEFFYLPGKGTLLKQNGKAMGPVLEGVDFIRVFWDIYFGKDSCCDDMKAQILKTCK